MGGCWNRCASCVLILVIIVAAALGACYFYALPRLDALLADSLRRELMLPPTSKVKIVRGNLLDTAQGRVNRVIIESDEAKLDGLVVEDLRFIAEGINFDLPQTIATKQAKFNEVSSGHISLRASAQALTDYWASELEPLGLSKIKVELNNEKAKISGLYHILVTDIRISASGVFKVDGTQRIKFHATDFDLGGVSVNIEEFKAVFSKLTPVVNLGRFKMAVVVDELRSSDGYLYIVARSQSLAERDSAEQQQRQQEQLESTEPTGEKPEQPEAAAADPAPAATDS